MPRLNWGKRIFGSTYPLAKHFAEITALMFFQPPELLTKAPSLIDAYAAVLGLVGYTVWITLDMVILLIERARTFAQSLKHGGQS